MKLAKSKYHDEYMKWFKVMLTNLNDVNKVYTTIDLVSMMGKEASALRGIQRAFLRHLENRKVLQFLGTRHIVSRARAGQVVKRYKWSQLFVEKWLPYYKKLRLSGENRQAAALMNNLLSTGGLATQTELFLRKYGAPIKDPTTEKQKTYTLGQFVSSFFTSREVYGSIETISEVVKDLKEAVDKAAKKLEETEAQAKKKSQKIRVCIVEE